MDTPSSHESTSSVTAQEVTAIPRFPENKPVKISTRRTHFVRYHDVPGDDDMTVIE